MGTGGGMLEPGTEGASEILAHMVLDGATHLPVQLSAHGLFHEGLHNPVVPKDPGPHLVTLRGKLRALVGQILDIILAPHLLQHLDHAGLCYSQAFSNPADLDQVPSLFLEES